MEQTVELTKQERRKLKRKRRRKRVRRVLVFGLLIFFLFGTNWGSDLRSGLRTVDRGDVEYTFSQWQHWFQEIFPGIRTKIGEFLNYIANFS